MSLKFIEPLSALSTYQQLADVTHILGTQAKAALASKVDMLVGFEKILGFLTLPQLISPAAQVWQFCHCSLLTVC